MEILSLLPDIYNRFCEFVLIFMRISALFATFTLFKRETVTTRIIVSLATILSVYVLLLTPSHHLQYDIMSLQMTIQMLFQFFVGFIAGIILNIVYEIFLMFGQIVSMQIGLSMASLFDPRYGSITSLSNFYMIVTSVVFLSLNGHLIIIKMMVDSFNSLSILAVYSPNNIISSVLAYSSIIFVGAIKASLTVIITILLVNVALAFMSKFAPQVNIFSIGVNITSIVGLICILLTFNMFINIEVSTINENLVYLYHALARLK